MKLRQRLHLLRPMSTHQLLSLDRAQHLSRTSDLPPIEAQHGDHAFTPALLLWESPTSSRQTPKRSS